MNTNSVKFIWADNLRAIATIAVVVVHVSGSILYEYGNINDSIWWAGNIADGISRFCVPIFLMLTGALLLSRKIELTTFLKKRLSRIFLPFVFWSIIYIVYNLAFSPPSGEILSIKETALYIFHKMKSGASFHFWYIYMILGIYLFIPIINKWIIHSSKKEILYYLIIWLITVFVSFPFIKLYFPNIDLLYFSGYLGYPVLGYFLSKINFNRIKLIASLLFILGSTITIIGTYILTKYNGEFNKVFYSYLSINVISAASGLFLLIKHSKIKATRINTVVKLISKYSYGIYLSHILIIKVLSKFGVTGYSNYPILSIFITTFSSILLSLFIVYLINKIPYGKYISG